MAQEPGQLLLQYRLIEKIGEGGMGSVWRAEDTSLDREAAIKVLPEVLANDAQFLARFEREAKLLASISHPNLAAVYGVHDVGSTRFLAMQLVPGEDLSACLLRGPLSIEDTIAIMCGIADALEAAHARGVVHRDLKPANVRLTPDGGVKVLDFGLAKSFGDGNAIRPGSGTGPDVSLTATGVALGTAPYMSPEQARGQAVDARTDIWAFGCVLWECLTGRRLVRGDSVPDLVVMILNNEPDWSELPPNTPRALRRLLRRCLEKSAHERLHHIADARIELWQAAEELRGASSADETAGPSPRRRARVLPIVVVALMAAAAGWFARPQRINTAPAPRDRLLADARFDWVTNLPGEEVDAAISPDGEYIAFLGDEAGQFDAYAGRIGAGEFVKLNGDSAIVSPKYLQAGVRRVGFRGDGDALWVGGTDDRKLRMISWPGLQTSPWLEIGVIHTDWHPTADRIVFSLSSGGDPLSLADADGTNPVELKLPIHDGYHQHFPTWSPDGKWIYLCRGRVNRGEMDLWRVRPDGSDLQQLTTTIGDAACPVPIDDRTVLLIGEDRDGTGPWLWELDLETRVPRRATGGVLIYKSLSASRDRRRLVASVVKPQVGLFTVPILPDERTASEADVARHPLKAVRALAPRVVDDGMYYLSSIGGSDSLWCARGGKPELIWKASGLARLEHAPAVEPQGDRVAIVVNEFRSGRLWLVNADGTQPRMLTDEVDVIGGASWSPDGKWIAVGGRRNGEPGLFKVRVADGHVEPLAEGEAMNPVWSPDDSMIIYASRQTGPTQLLLAVSPDGARAKFPLLRVAVVGERVRFLPDGKRIVVLMGLDPKFELRMFDLAAGTSRVLAKFDSSASMRAFDIMPDGKSIVFDRQQDNADIVLITRD